MSSGFFRTIVRPSVRRSYSVVHNGGQRQDVKTVDQLMHVVRKLSDPSRHSAMSMRRTPISWSETLLNSKKPTPSPSPSKFISTPRRMQDSYCEIMLPFSSEPQLLEQYTNASGGIRTGKIFEHLDALAGSIAYRHNLGPDVQTLGNIEERGFYIVTASVDRLDMLAPVRPVDLRLSGHVIHVGKSSMDVVVQLEALGMDGGEETLMLGRFCMVCRDAQTKLAHPVSPLILSTPEEQGLAEVGRGFKMTRQLQAEKSLTRVPPTAEEAEELHSLFLKYGQQDDAYIPSVVQEDERVWMSDTRLEKCTLMFPQERNVHGKIFGGYLMRLAYELGFTNARLFTRQPVRFLSLDKIAFTRPVPIGSILKLRAMVMHTTASGTSPSLVHVGVEANVVDVSTGSEQTTNDFRFTWAVDEPLARRVVPRTYEESMYWLEARRSLGMIPLT